MTFSINTNASALNALQTLSLTNRSLDETQNRVNTGLEVRNAKDNAAVFAIAQNLRANFEGLDAVKQSLDRSISTADIALAATESIADLLIQMKEKVVAAADVGLDASSRDALRQDFESLRDQIGIIISNAEFNGTNLLDGNGDIVTAITNASATQTISISHQDLSLGAGTSPGTIILLGAASTFASAGDAATLVTAIDSSITAVSSSMTALGAGARAMENQRIFVDKLSDTIEAGIGNLVDADLARESARLQSLQVKQQLGVQALSIANARPQVILSLFSG
ncbi:MAG: flagellin [Sphingomonadales bacterium]|nr:flagellin [Sphingomonadales bacterium]